ncbi:MAG: hypothetical protein MJZ81_07380 [Bacteroidales bacterium]|nr:hypothetical protein [Bacteroidales bacterium]
MATHDENFKEIYDRINSLEQGQAETNGYLRAVVENGKMQYEQTKDVIATFTAGTDKYIKLVWKMVLILTFGFFVAIFAVIYGAIGDKGLKSVRESIPSIPTAGFLNPAIPWHGDRFDIKTLALQSDGAV